MSYRPDQTSLEFFLSPGEVWPVMYEDCLKAEKSIYLEQYILMNDQIGRDFMHLFIAKAKQGIAVTLMLDRIGSRTLYGSPLVKMLREAGGRVDFYHDINMTTLFRPSQWFPRNHRKNLIIDSQIAYIGSVCMAQHMRFWRDTHTKFTGDLVKKVEQASSRKYKNHVPAIHGDYDYIAVSAKLRRNELYKQLLDRIQKATTTIKLVTPYFLPPRRLLKLLGKAVKRGVDVQIMIGRRSDVPVADMVSRSYLPKIFKLGIRVIFYEANILHAKYMMIDGEWATVGSSNLDYLSLVRNKEANIIIYDGEKIGELERHYANDIDVSSEMTMEYYTHLPLYYKLLGKIGRAFRWVL